MTCKYTISQYVRQITDITQDDLSDPKLTALASFAWNDIMGRIMKIETNEKAERIDKHRTNKVDGVNKEFYVKHSENRFLGDLNYDMELTTDDVQVHSIDKTGESRTEETVDEITNLGKITLETAPENQGKIYITYAHLPLSITPLNPMIRDAVAYQTASLAYGKLDPADYEAISFRGLSVRKGNPFRMPAAYDVWGARAWDKVTQINNMQTVVRIQDTPIIYVNRDLRPSRARSIRQGGY